MQYNPKRPGETPVKNKPNFQWIAEDVEEILNHQNSPKGFLEQVLEEMFYLGRESKEKEHKNA